MTLGQVHYIVFLFFLQCRVIWGLIRNLLNSVAWIVMTFYASLFTFTIVFVSTSHEELSCQKNPQRCLSKNCIQLFRQISRTTGKRTDCIYDPTVECRCGNITVCDCCSLSCTGKLYVIRGNMKIVIFSLYIYIFIGF